MRGLRVWVDVLDSSAGTAALPSPRSKKKKGCLDLEDTADLSNNHGEKL